MGSFFPPAGAAVAAFAALAAVALQTKILRRDRAARLRLRLQFPTSRRVDLAATFDGTGETGPFFVRVRLRAGRDVALTASAGEGAVGRAFARREALAPMAPAPVLGEAHHRLVGAVSLVSELAEPSGRLEVAVLDRSGRVLAGRTLDV